ncbi:hypothetical protein HZC34_03305 [Candidatus Saganbacteria bacterium]|nr:hypothetical protein [Candidatus Saganbacteria bacterium]
MDKTQKVIEYINHHLMADYLQKLVNVKMGKITLFSVMPFTGAPNVSDPHYYIKILNPELVAELLKKDLN